MKRRWFTISAICLLFIIIAAAFLFNPQITPDSGYYYAAGNYKEKETPYLLLEPETQTFRLGMGAYSSYAETGSYEISGKTLTATSGNTTYVFRMKTRKSLVLIDNGDHAYLQPPENTVFSYDNILR